MNIDPYTSVGPIKFGMSELDVRAALGEPASISKDRRDNDVMRYEGIKVTVAPHGVTEVALLPTVPVTLRGIKIFSSSSAFTDLCELDGDPQIVVGFVVLLNLGIALTGFHDQDESQKAVTVFERGRWDVLRDQMAPLE